MAYAFNDDKTKADIKKKTVTYTNTSHYSSGESYSYPVELGISQDDMLLGIGVIDVTFGNPNVSIRPTSYIISHRNGEVIAWVNVTWDSGQGATALVTVTVEVIYL